MKQCKFYDIENGVIHGGILTDDGNIICGCCGGLIESDEIGDGEDCTHRILEVYNTWVDLTPEICGDDLCDDYDHQYFGIVRWCDADIAGLLESIGVEPTDENVEEVRCACINNHHFTDNMIEAGWETLEQYAKDALGLFVRE